MDATEVGLGKCSCALVPHSMIRSLSQLCLPTVAKLIYTSDQEWLPDRECHEWFSIHNSSLRSVYMMEHQQQNKSP